MNGEPALHPWSRREWPWLLALALLAFLAFLPAVNYPFLIEWDDCAYVTAPTLAPSWANVGYWLDHATGGGFTPLTMWSLMLDRWLFGLNPMVFHLHNQLLHCLAALLLYAIARRLRVSPWAAFLLALLWAVHPQRVESVVWITERKDVLAGVFGFGAMLLFMRAFDRGRMPWAAAAALLLALAAKPSTVTLPAVMAVYALWRRPRLDSLLRIAPVMAVAVAHYLNFYLLSRDAVHGVLEGFPRLLLVPLHNAAWYLLTAFVPYELNPVYPRVACGLTLWLALAAGCAAALAGALCLRRTALGRLLPFAAVWLCLFLPVSAAARFGNADYCDRFNYLLSAAAWLALGALADRWARDAFRRKLAAAAVLGAAVAYLFLTWSYLPFWQDTKTLFVRAVEGVSRPNVRAVLGLGEVGMNRNEPALLEAAGNLLLSMSKESAAAPPAAALEDPEALYTTGLFFSGMALKLSGQPAEALRALRLVEAKGCNGGLPLYLGDDLAFRLWGELAGCYLEARRPQDALRCLRNQLPLLRPGSVEARFCRGMIAFLQGDYQAAQREWRAALASSPDDAKTLHNLRNLEANYLQDGRGGAR